MSSPAQFADPGRPLAVVTTVTPWHEPPRIRHQLTRQLCRFFNVLYIELPFGGGKRRPAGTERIDDRLRIIRFRHLPRGFGRLWKNVAFVNDAYNRRLAGKIVTHLRALTDTNATLFNFQFNFPQIMRTDAFDAKVYVCNDEFVLRVDDPAERARRQRQETDVIRGADLCIAVSESLRDKLGLIKPNAHLVMPGHEFAIDQKLEVTLPEARNTISVAYMGYINHRLRFDWFEAVLRATNMTLTLIGPIEDAAAVEHFSRFENYRHVPPLTGDALRKELKQHDVLTMPYDTTQVGVQASSAPNKLFQYLACARPIAIAAMPQLIPLPDQFVYQAESAEEFLAAIRRAADEDSQALRAARLDFARRNSWDARGDQIRALLQTLSTEEHQI